METELDEVARKLEGRLRALVPQDSTEMGSYSLDATAEELKEDVYAFWMYEWPSSLVVVLRLMLHCFQSPDELEDDDSWWPELDLVLFALNVESKSPYSDSKEARDEDSYQRCSTEVNSWSIADVGLVLEYLVAIRDVPFVKDCKAFEHAECVRYWGELLQTKRARG